MKKYLPIVFITGALPAFAAQYNVIISKEHNNYEERKATMIKSETTYSEWNTISESNCIFDLDQSDFYYDKDFNQTKTCDENQTRTATTTNYYSDNSVDTVVKTESKIIKDIESSYVEKGTHVENTCKDILSFNSSLGDDSYYIEHNGGMTVDCDMTTDGGGWTKIVTANKIDNGIYSELLFTDYDLTYSEVLFVDNGNIGDFAVPITNNYYDWTGYHPAWNAIKLNDTWYNTVTGSTIPGDITNKLPISRFNTLESSKGVCYAETNIVDPYCAEKIIIDVSGYKVSGISDTQSLSSAFIENNYFEMKFFLYVR